MANFLKTTSLVFILFGSIATLTQGQKQYHQEVNPGKRPQRGVVFSAPELLVNQQYANAAASLDDSAQSELANQIFFQQHQVATLPVGQPQSVQYGPPQLTHQAQAQPQQVPTSGAGYATAPQVAAQPEQQQSTIGVYNQYGTRVGEQQLVRQGQHQLIQQTVGQIPIQQQQLFLSQNPQLFQHLHPQPQTIVQHQHSLFLPQPAPAYVLQQQPQVVNQPQPLFQQVLQPQPAPLLQQPQRLFQQVLQPQPAQLLQQFLPQHHFVPQPAPAVVHQQKLLQPRPAPPLQYFVPHGAAAPVLQQQFLHQPEQVLHEIHHPDAPVPLLETQPIVHFQQQYLQPPTVIQPVAKVYTPLHYARKVIQPVTKVEAPHYLPPKATPSVLVEKDPVHLVEEPVLLAPAPNLQIIKQPILPPAVFQQEIFAIKNPRSRVLTYSDLCTVYPYQRKLAACVHKKALIPELHHPDFQLVSEQSQNNPSPSALQDRSQASRISSAYEADSSDTSINPTTTDNSFLALDKDEDGFSGLSSNAKTEEELLKEIEQEDVASSNQSEKKVKSVISTTTKRTMRKNKAPVKKPTSTSTVATTTTTTEVTTPTTAETTTTKKPKRRRSSNTRKNQKRRLQEQTTTPKATEGKSFKLA